MKTLHTFLTLLLVLMMSSLQTLSAQENKDGKTSDIPATGWYVGIDGGVPQASPCWERMLALHIACIIG